MLIIAFICALILWIDAKHGFCTLCVMFIFMTLIFLISENFNRDMFMKQRFGATQILKKDNEHCAYKLLTSSDTVIWVCLQEDRK
jgi:small-conductance mechanosensitive channel